MLYLNLFTNLYKLGKNYCLNSPKDNSDLLDAYLKLVQVKSIGKMYAVSSDNNEYILMTFSEDIDYFIVEKLEAIDTLIIIIPSNVAQMTNMQLNYFVNNLLDSIISEYSRVIIEDPSSFDMFCRECIKADLIYDFYISYYDDQSLEHLFFDDLKPYIPHKLLTEPDTSLIFKIINNKFNYMDFLEYDEEYKLYISTIKKNDDPNILPL